MPDPHSFEKTSVLISYDELLEIIERLAEEIARDYEEQELKLVGVLKGSFIFMSLLTVALWRKGHRKTTVDFVGVKSYHGTQSNHAPEITVELSMDIEGKHVLLVEDILDGGHTLDFLTKKFAERDPGSLKTVVMLDKPEGRLVPIQADYVGKVIDNVWVEGFGLDYDEFNRGCPDIFTRHLD